MTPPRTMERLLHALGAGAAYANAVLGDLAEEHAERVAFQGEIAARRWYRREAVRVAPHLLLLWWRDPRPGDLLRLVAAMGAASGALVGFEWLAASTVGPVVASWAQGTPLLPALMLSWTLTDGALAGWVAAVVGRRAPVASALAVAAAWPALMMAMQDAHVPLWFRLANALVFAVGAIAGGVARVTEQQSSTFASR